jgi:hypothetical protein
LPIEKDTQFEKQSLNKLHIGWDCFEKRSLTNWKEHTLKSNPIPYECAWPNQPKLQFKPIINSIQLSATTLKRHETRHVIAQFIWPNHPKFLFKPIINSIQLSATTLEHH